MNCDLKLLWLFTNSDYPFLLLVQIGEILLLFGECGLHVVHQIQFHVTPAITSPFRVSQR